MKNFHYSEQMPAPALSEYVLSYWTFKTRVPPGETFLHHVWPDGCVRVVFWIRAGQLTRVGVVGPDLQARRVPLEGDWVFRGIRLWPDAAKSLLNLDPLSLRNRAVESQEVSLRCEEVGKALAGIEGEEVATEIFNRWLLESARPVRYLDPDVRMTVKALIDGRGADRVADLARQVGLSTRQLQRKFRRLTGLTPKEFARIRRVRSTINTILTGEPRWASLATEFGYADQSHMIRDFVEITGMTPTEFEQRLGIIEHGRVVP